MNYDTHWQVSAKPEHACRIADIATDAYQLYTTLQAEGFSESEAYSLVQSSMPVIIQMEMQ